MSIITKIKIKGSKMNEIEKKKSSRTYDLISSVAKMDKTPLKFLNWQYLILIRIIHQKTILLSFKRTL
jgi:hypothetical protein